METIAAWIAPSATMIAAMMTAANLGARVTGWGFIVFTVGSLAWSLIGYATGQPNLLATNAFLTIVNLVGIWRWLGRQAGYEDGGKSATRASRRAATPDLFTATGIAGAQVVDRQGTELGRAVEALIACDRGEINYVVVAAGGVGGIEERLRAVPRSKITFMSDLLKLNMTEPEFCALPTLVAGDWPAQVASAAP